ncbi:MAG TPA: flagellar hook basal-body protein [Caulifigura sp.]|jgi:flagellar basal body rod protein FlgG|nr:flagellar hook basal-body protein [Caulifigura sp.]
MDAGRGSYLCGLVLGVAVGVAGTHVALSGRTGQAPIRLPELSIPAPVPHETRLDLPPLEGLTPELKTAFAPAPVTVHAIATSPAEGSDDEHALPEPPRQLPEMTDVEPLQAEKPTEDAGLRAFIRDELQTLAAHEHDVWYETLHGLSREDATEILRIWKFTRGLSEPVDIPGFPKLAALTAKEAAPAAAPVATPAPPSAVSPGVQTLSQAEALRRVCRLNLTNAATPGFKRREVMLFDHAEQAGGSSEPLVWINHSAGKQTNTGRPFDCSINGPGFFKVQRGTETYLTRCGRFIRTPSGHLALPQPKGDPCLLQPEVIVPEGCESLRIETDGAVHVKTAGAAEERLAGTIRLYNVFDPSALKPEPDNLFAMTPASGAERLVTGEESTIWQGSIEESNVDPAAERLKLETVSATATR